MAILNLPSTPLPTWAIVVLAAVSAPLLAWLWLDVLHRHVFSPFKSVPYAKNHVPILGHLPKMLAESWGGPMVNWTRTTLTNRTGFYRIFMGPYEWLVPTTTQAIAAISTRPFDFVLESAIFDCVIPMSLLTCKVQAHHRDLRKIYAQTLGKARNAANLACAWITSDKLRARMTSAGSAVWNVQHELLVANTETMLRVLFSVDVDCTQGQGAIIDTSIDDYIVALNRDGWTGTLIWILAPTFISYATLLKMPFSIMRRYQRGNAILRSYVKTQIRQRKLEIEGKEGGIVAKDMLGVFLQAGAMEEETLIDNMITLLLAGRQNSATVVSWALYELARNQTVQDRLRDELETAFSGSSAYDPPTPAQVNALPYLKAVTMEAIRLYPFFASFTTTAIHDTYIEDLAVPAGSRFVVPLWAISRQTNLWGPDAAEFRPERWLESANGGATSPYAFMSFSHGPRQCAGKEFAMITVLSLLANMVRGLRYEAVGEPPSFERGTTLTPLGGLSLKVAAIAKS